jgi:hypothetical protein
MSGVYGFWQGPTYRASTREELFSAALDMPMSAGSTFWDQAKGGALESFGLGSAIRDFKTPDGAPLAAGRYERPDEFKARRDAFAAENKVLDADGYTASPYFREGVPWDASMTEDKAAALAAMYDAKQVRQYFAEKRPITAFLGNLAGQAVDPINYIPVAGPSVRAAAVARMGLVKGVAATAALDAAANTAIAGLATRETRRSYGDDVSWQAMISEIATAALIGSAFGTVGGALERRAGLRADALRADAEVKVQTLKATQEARIALNEAIGGLATDGEVRLSPNATAPIERIVAETSAAPRSSIGADVVEPPVPPGMVRVYHSGQSIGEGETGRWVSTNRTYASDYRRDLPLHYLDLPENDPRLVNADVPEQGVKQGFTFNFETTPQEAAKLTQISRGGISAKPSSLADDLSIDASQYRGDMVAAVKIGGKVFVGDMHADAMAKAIRQFGADSAEVRSFENLDDPMTAMGVVEQGRGFREGISGDGGRSARGQMTVLKMQDRLDAFERRNKLAQNSIDISPARPDPIPEGRTEAEAKVAKPENYKALADQYRVDPETGAFPEEAELRQLAQEGRLSEEDMAVLDDADAAYQDGVSYGEALKSVVGCLL